MCVFFLVPPLGVGPFLGRVSPSRGEGLGIYPSSSFRVLAFFSGVLAPLAGRRRNLSFFLICPFSVGGGI